LATWRWELCVVDNEEVTDGINGPDASEVIVTGNSD
jgi:hypothetical protein